MALKHDLEATRPVVGGDPLPSTAWHPEFEDVNNDGDMDLFVTKGNVNQIPDYAKKDPNNLFLGQSDGMFVERSEAAGIVSFDRGRGAALADFNSDGLLDLVVANLGAPARLWRNVGTGSADAPGADGRLARGPDPRGRHEPGRHRGDHRDEGSATPSLGGRSSSAVATRAASSAGPTSVSDRRRRPTSG